MTHVQKATLLLERIERVIKNQPDKKVRKAKYIALMVIDEIQKVAERGQAAPEYWTKVRQEIENLR